MPIIEKQELNLTKHIWPLLSPFAPQYDDRVGGTAEGISTTLGYVSICNTNQLYVEGKRELANYLLEHCRPYGKELTIHFYPKDVKLAEEKSFIGTMVHRLRMMEAE